MARWRVEEYADFDPRRHYAPALTGDELSEDERNAARRNATRADEVPLDLP